MHGSALMSWRGNRVATAVLADPTPQLHQRPAAERPGKGTESKPHFLGHKMRVVLEIERQNPAEGLDPGICLFMVFPQFPEY